MVLPFQTKKSGHRGCHEARIGRDGRWTRGGGLTDHPSTVIGTNKIVPSSIPRASAASGAPATFPLRKQATLGRVPAPHRGEMELEATSTLRSCISAYT